MRFGLTNEEYNFIQNNVIVPLQKYDTTVWCFGSRARGDYKKFSDLDLMLETSKAGDGYAFIQEVGRIKDFLSASNFPYKVDIVILSDFAQSYRAGYERDKQKFT